ncbi:hypothetical protein AYI70_g7189 [Smittium culicis]|uniref:Uncharacterized protein n=1 Tax=Smittium culicis TaxID=133412 RepID=A0A1R1XLQ8_9FUNG|nr:hypothetical protein AYI70_g7189 [Smittium culicis]
MKANTIFLYVSIYFYSSVSTQLSSADYNPKDDPLEGKISKSTSLTLIDLNFSAGAAEVFDAVDPDAFPKDQFVDPSAALDYTADVYAVLEGVQNYTADMYAVHEEGVHDYTVDVYAVLEGVQNYTADMYAVHEEGVHDYTVDVYAVLEGVQNYTADMYAVHEEDVHDYTVDVYAVLEGVQNYTADVYAVLEGVHGYTADVYAVLEGLREYAAGKSKNHPTLSDTPIYPRIPIHRHQKPTLKYFGRYSRRSRIRRPNFHIRPRFKTTRFRPIFRSTYKHGHIRRHVHKANFRRSPLFSPRRFVPSRVLINRRVFNRPTRGRVIRISPIVTRRRNVFARQYSSPPLVNVVSERESSETPKDTSTKSSEGKIQKNDFFDYEKSRNSFGFGFNDYGFQVNRELPGNNRGLVVIENKFIRKKKSIKNKNNTNIYQPEIIGERKNVVTNPYLASNRSILNDGKGRINVSSGISVSKKVHNKSNGPRFYAIPGNVEKVNLDSTPSIKIIQNPVRKSRIPAINNSVKNKDNDDSFVKDLEKMIGNGRNDFGEPSSPTAVIEAKIKNSTLYQTRYETKLMTEFETKSQANYKIINQTENMTVTRTV